VKTFAAATSTDETSEAIRKQLGISAAEWAKANA
jgi:hypothetical protein